MNDPKTQGADSPTGFFNKRIVIAIALALVFITHFGITLWWFNQDNHPIWGDEESHLLQARAYYSALTQPGAGVLDRLRAVMTLPPPYPMHPPFAHVAGAIFAILFGYRVDSMAAVSLAAFLFLLWGVWRLARSFLTPAQALFAVIVVSLTPGLYLASRYFMTDYPLVALVVWIMSLAVSGRLFLHPGRAALLGLFMGLAMLSRSIAPVYVLLPLFIAFIQDGRTAYRENPSGHLPNGARLFGCGLLAVVIALAIAAPWHIYHRAAFENFWFQQHAGSHGKPVTFMKTAETAATPASDKVEKASKAPSAQASPPKKSGWTIPLAWTTYPVHIINNGLFLPLSLLAFVGFILLFFSGCRGRYKEWLLFAWIGGGGMALTLLFTIATPRYALPLLPGLALLGAWAVLRIPWRSVRYVCGALLLTYLLFAHANLTYLSLPASCAQYYLPIIPAPAIQAQYEDPGLCLYKNRLALGQAYTWLGAPEKENYRDALFAVMVNAERKSPLPRGGVARFGVVNMRGLDFDALHYWPGDANHPNAFFNADLPDTLRLPRSLVLTPRVADAEELAPASESLDYIVCAVDDSVRQRRNAWKAWLQQHAYIPLSSVSQPRRNTAPAREFLIYQKSIPAAWTQVQNDADIKALDLTALLSLFNYLPTTADKELPWLTPARKQLQTLMADHPVKGMLNAAMALQDLSWHSDADGWITYRFVLGVKTFLPNDYRIRLRGLAVENNAVVGAADFGELLLAPAACWQPGTYVLVTTRIPAAMFPDVLEIYSLEQTPGAQPTVIRLPLSSTSS